MGKREICLNLTTKIRAGEMVVIGRRDDDTLVISGIESPLKKTWGEGGEGRGFCNVVGMTLLGKSVEKRITENFCPVGRGGVEVFP